MASVTKRHKTYVFVLVSKDGKPYIRSCSMQSYLVRRWARGNLTPQGSPAWEWRQFYKLGYRVRRATLEYQT